MDFFAIWTLQHKRFYFNPSIKSAYLCYKKNIFCEKREQQKVGKREKNMKKKDERKLKVIRVKQMQKKAKMKAKDCV
jgi:hypothetical protein